MDGSGNLIITDINGAMSDDAITISEDGAGNYIITDPNLALTTVATGGRLAIPNAVRVNGNTIRVPKADVTGLIVNTEGNATATADVVTFGGANAIDFDGDIVVNAATEGTVISQSLASSTGDVTFNGDVTVGADATVSGTDVAFNGAAALGGNTLTVDVSGTGTMSGAVTSTNGGLTKDGGGTLSVTGVVTATGLTGNVDDGVMVVSNGGNTIDAATSEFNVAAGAELIGFTDETLGEAEINLNGGDLTINAGSNLFVPGLIETVYAGRNIDNPTGGAVIGGPQVYTSVRAGETNFGAGSPNDPTGASGPWRFTGNNETVVYTGQFFDADGIFAFGENIDDDVLIRIDGQEVLRNTQWNVPTTTASTTNNSGANATGALNFGMGPNGDGWHDVELRFAGGSGGNGAVGGNGWAANFGFGVNTNPVAPFTSNQGGDYTAPVDPGDQSVFRTPSANPSIIANVVNVTADSAINIGSNVTGVESTGSLNFSADVDLEVNSIDMHQLLEFADTTMAGGTATVNGVGMPEITLNNITETAASNLTIGGDAIVFLPTANAYTGATTVKGGAEDATLEISHGDALGNPAGAGTVVEAGGSLRLTGGIAVNAGETLSIAGTGSTKSAGALHSESGDNDFGGAITLTGGATIRTSANSLDLLGGIDTGTSEVRFDSVGTTRVQTTGISGDGSVRKEENGTLELFVDSSYTGQTQINNGVVDIRTDNGLGDVAGSTTITGNGTLRLRGNINSAENLTLNGGDGEGSQGMIRKVVRVVREDPPPCARRAAPGR